jgi:hypothetical protein
MMEYSISKLERGLIIAFGLLAISYFATGIFAEGIHSYNESVVQYQNGLARQAGVKNIISFAACGGFDYSIPLFHLITFPIFLTLIRTRTYIVSTTFTVLYLTLLIVSISIRLDGRGSLGSENFFTNPLLELWTKTSIHDYFSAFVTVVLLFWQGCVLWRIQKHGPRTIDLL